MSGTPDELRLVYTLLLNAAVLAGACRFAARRGSGRLGDTLADTGLLYLLVQYAAVGVPGLLGVLSTLTIGAATIVAAAMLWCAAGRRGVASPLPPSSLIVPPSSFAAASPWVARLTLLFAAGFLASIFFYERWLPPVSEDVLTYHLPAAVQWLRQGRISLFPTWFFNPANTYSPLAGSVLEAWWLAPIGNDFLARFVQLPALLLIFIAMRQLARSLGAAPALAATLAAAAVLCRSFLNEAVEPKDDLLLCACFLCVAAGCAARRLRDPLGAWRIGAALGLMLATKYTALYALLALVPAVDAPFRAGWKARQWAITAALAALLAGPWYLRNWILTGNPLYPMQVSIAGHSVFHGLFHTQRSTELTSGAGVWQALVMHYRSPGPALLIVLAAGWAGALEVGLAGKGKSVLRDPLVRLCVAGPVVGVGLFLLTSPYPEVRFILPPVLLLFGCCAIALLHLHGRAGWQLPAVLIGAGIAVLAAVTAFAPVRVAPRLREAAVLAAAGIPLVWLLGRPWFRAWWMRDRLLLAGGLAALGLAAWVYVDYKAMLNEYRATAVPSGWRQWPGSGEAWLFVRDHIPPDATIAYTNDHLVYPLLGFDLTRPAIYVPTRLGITRISDLPPFPTAVNAENMIAIFSESLWRDAEGALWLKRLRASGATFLLVNHPKGATASTPPELGFAAENPAVFQPVFQNKEETLSIFRIVW